MSALACKALEDHNLKYVNKSTLFKTSWTHHKTHQERQGSFFSSQWEACGVACRGKEGPVLWLQVVLKRWLVLIHRWLLAFPFGGLSWEGGPFGFGSGWCSNGGLCSSATSRTFSFGLFPSWARLVLGEWLVSIFLGVLQEKRLLGWCLWGWLVPLRGPFLLERVVAVVKLLRNGGVEEHQG
ncbi:uncharacterized protein J3R85_001667 [Psidium guajava]|nr:uncharacterized protein J3R85_001667 [Psidium guajava]